MTEKEKEQVRIIAERTYRILKQVMDKKANVHCMEQDLAMICNDALFLIGLVRKSEEASEENKKD